MKAVFNCRIEDKKRGERLAVAFPLFCTGTNYGQIADAAGLYVAYFPKTFLSSSVALAAGSVLIFFSSSPNMVKSPSTALFAT